MSDDEDQDLLELLRQHLGLNGANTNAPPDTGVLRDARFIYDNSVDVAIDMLGTRNAARVIYEQMQKRDYSTKTWSEHELYVRIKGRSMDEWPVMTPATKAQDLPLGPGSAEVDASIDDVTENLTDPSSIEGTAIGQTTIHGSTVNTSSSGISIDVEAPRAPYTEISSNVSLSVEPRSAETAVLEPECSGPRGVSLDESVVNFIFTMNLLDFSFWADATLAGTQDRASLRSTNGGQASREELQFAVTYNNKTYTGHWSLVAALHRALDDGVPITTPDFWRSSETCTDRLLQAVFHSSTAHPLPLLTERIDILRSAAKVLDEEYDGSVLNLIAEAKQSAAWLVNILASKFDCFRDEARFEGKTVRFQKRAQIFVADLWACFEGQSYGTFTDIDTALTTFPGYRIPQILHTLGCIQYSPPLEGKIRKGVEIQSGSTLEIEIRGCSIWGVEMIRKEILRQHSEAKINAILMDFFLYDWMKEIEREGEHGVSEVNGEGGRLAMDILPHHHTRSIWY